MTLTSIGEVHRVVSEALASQDAVVLDLTDVESYDLSFVQLVESARKTAARNGKGLELAAPADGDLLEVLHRGGFLTERDPVASAFWLRAAEAA